MELVSNWRSVLTRAWSVQLMYLAAFLNVAVQAVPFMSEIIPWWVSVLVIVAAILVRPIKQSSVSGTDE